MLFILNKEKGKKRQRITSQKGNIVTVRPIALSFFFFSFPFFLGAMRICYYDLLGVDRQATSLDIKKAYRQQALIWHPGKLTNVHINKSINFFL